VVLAVGGGIALAQLPEPSGDTAPAAGPLLVERFNGPDGVITNSYAFWDGDRDPAAVRSPVWEVEAGTFFRRGGAGWSGVPDDADTDRISRFGTGSEVFRMWTRRSDFGDVAVEAELYNEGWTTGSPGWRAKSWDGIKLWLRRQGRSGADVRFYSVEVNRRQGNVLIQKKCAEDRYVVLARSGARRHPARVRDWERVGGTVRNARDGSVWIELLRGGDVLLRARDDGRLCAPLRSPGRVGIRADNAQFRVDDFVVRRHGLAPARR
jgi:hypothetical protein